MLLPPPVVARWSVLVVLLAAAQLSEYAPLGAGQTEFPSTSVKALAHHP